MGEIESTLTESDMDLIKKMIQIAVLESRIETLTRSINGYKRRFWIDVAIVVVALIVWFSVSKP